MTIEKLAFGLYCAFERSRRSVGNRRQRVSDPSIAVDWTSLSSEKRVAWRAAAEYALSLAPSPSPPQAETPHGAGESTRCCDPQQDGVVCCTLCPCPKCKPGCPCNDVQSSAPGRPA